MSKVSKEEIIKTMLDHNERDGCFYLLMVDKDDLDIELVFKEKKLFLSESLLHLLIESGDLILRLEPKLSASEI